MADRELYCVAGMLDATALARYHADGAVVVRGLLDETGLESAISAIVERLDLIECRRGAGAPAPSENSVKEASRRLQAIVKARPDLQSILYDNLSHAPAMHRMVADTRILTAVQAILSPNISIHPRLVMLMSMPHETWHLALWHQDWYYNEGPRRTVTVYAPLQRTTAQNGSLLLALGEHKQGLLPHADFDGPHKTKWHVIAPSETERFGSVVSTVLDPGDVLFLDSLLPHSAQLNRSDDVRFVLNFRYLDLSDRDYLNADWRLSDVPRARQALARKAAKPVRR
jgi:ectoine hydroxylase-related dioxygenase (phytanoyl-CoA dioxygenase family)